jgi:hypothetical protein
MSYEERVHQLSAPLTELSVTLWSLSYNFVLLFGNGGFRTIVCLSS